MFDLTAERTAFAQWKVYSTGVNVARQLAGARNRGRQSWLTEHGTDPERWPLPHPPLVLWLPYRPFAACAACTWLHRPWGGRVHVSPFCMFLRLELTRTSVCNGRRLRIASPRDPPTVAYGPGETCGKVKHAGPRRRDSPREIRRPSRGDARALGGREA